MDQEGAPAAAAAPRFLHVRFLQSEEQFLGPNPVSRLVNTPEDIYQTISKAAENQLCFQRDDIGSALRIQDKYDGTSIALRPPFPYHALPRDFNNRGVDASTPLRVLGENMRCVREGGGAGVLCCIRKDPNSSAFAMCPDLG